MSEQLSFYLSPKLQGRLRADGNGNGIFAKAPLKKGELLAAFGGVVYEWDTFVTLPELERSLCIQVEDRHFLVPEKIGEGDYVNHSCNPNAGLSGQIALVAMRDIHPGEEVCFDYTMSDTMPYDEFPCGCGAHTCRGRVTGNDWKLPELQRRYAGFFAQHVQRHIDDYRAEQRAVRRQKAYPYAGAAALPATLHE